MSKPYRIRVEESVVARDYSTFQVDAPPLATPQEFSEILAEVMQEAGWTENEEGRLCFQVAEDEEYIFVPEKMQIQTVIEGSDEVHTDLEGWSQKDVNAKADKVVEQRSQALESQITQRLEASQGERREQFEAMVVDATGRALKEIAQRLGDVQDIHEERSEDGTYRLTIAIEERD